MPLTAPPVGVPVLPVGVPASPAATQLHQVGAQDFLLDHKNVTTGRFPVGVRGQLPPAITLAITPGLHTRASPADSAIRVDIPVPVLDANLPRNLG